MLECLFNSSNRIIISGDSGLEYVLLSVSGGSAPTVSGAAKSSDQPALTGRHHPDCAEGLCPALPVTAGRNTGDQSPWNSGDQSPRVPAVTKVVSWLCRICSI